MIKAIIFDMDGVIADTDKTRFELLKILLKKYGLMLEDKDYGKSIGKRTAKFLKEMFPKELSENKINQIFIARKEELHRNPEKYVIGQPKVFETCKYLFDHNYDLAIASVAASKDIEMVLKHLKIRDFFKVIVSSDDIQKMKPDPEVYLKAINALGLNKNECIAIEDSPIGIEAAKSAGLFCLGVTYTYKAKDLFLADKIINSLEEINYNFLQNIN